MVTDTPGNPISDPSIPPVEDGRIVQPSIEDDGSGLADALTGSDTSSDVPSTDEATDQAYTVHADDEDDA